ncbi:MAG: phage major capsid protein [Planctomycetota bacterium]|jgi:HK97 family phage major capsid protein
MRAVRDVRGGKYDDRLERFEQRAQQTIVGADGGFLVPPRFLEEIMMSAGDTEPWLMRRTIYQVDRQELSIPRFKDENRSSGDVAGLALARVGEGGAIAEDSVEFTATKIVLTKAAKLIPVSNELMMSGVGIEQALTRVIGKAVALRQAADFVGGTGSGEPLGIANGSDKASVASSSAAGALALSELGGMLAKLEGGGSNPTATWLAHPSTLKALIAMTSAGDTNPLFMPDGREGFTSTLFGVPIFFTDACEQLNAQGDIYLANLNAYSYAWKGILIDSSPDFKFSTDQTTFRVRLFDDGMPTRDGTRTDRQSYVQANNVDLAVRS